MACLLGQYLNFKVVNTEIPKMQRKFRWLKETEMEEKEMGQQIEGFPVFAFLIADKVEFDKMFKLMGGTNTRKNSAKRTFFMY